MQIENTDERLLRIISSVFDNYLNEAIVETSENIVSESIVAYYTTGNPLTLKQYNQEIDKELKTLIMEDLYLKKI